MPTLSDAEIARLAADAGWTGEDLEMAVAVALAESDGDTDRLGDLGIQSATYGPSVGLWQIRSVNPGHGNAFDQAHRNQRANLDPATNARNAYAIWAQPGRRGWREWGSVTDGRYRQFLDRARRAVGTQPAPATPERRGDVGGNGMSATLAELVGSLSRFGAQSNRLGQVARQAQQTVARGGAFGDVPGSRTAQQGNQRNADRSAEQAEGGRDRLDRVRDGVRTSGDRYERYDQDQGRRQGQEQIKIDNAYDAYRNYA